MAIVTVGASRMGEVLMMTGGSPDDPWSVIAIQGENVSLVIQADHDQIRRSRELAAKIIAGCASVEDRMRRAVAVPIASLAPDPEPVH